MLLTFCARIQIQEVQATALSGHLHIRRQALTYKLHLLLRCGVTDVKRVKMVTLEYELRNIRTDGLLIGFLKHEREKSHLFHFKFITVQIVLSSNASVPSRENISSAFITHTRAHAYAHTHTIYIYCFIYVCVREL
jgi:hypothetical protein